MSRERNLPKVPDMNVRTYVHLLRYALQLRWDASLRAPLTMNVQVTLRCNNRCRYCSYDREGPDRMSLPLLKAVFRDAWALGGRRVNLTGGEPLLRDDLSEIVRCARRMGFFVGISTSGARAGEQIEALRLCHQVMLSIDGPQDVRARLCGPKSAYESEAAVALFRRHAVPFWTTTVLTRINIPHIEWIVDLAQRNGSLANFVLLHTQPGEGVRFHPRIRDVEDLLPGTEELRGAIRRLIVLKRAGGAVGSSMPYLEEFLRWPDYTRICSPEPSSLYRCLAGRVSCELSADGRLHACGWARDRSAGVSMLPHGFAHAFRTLPRVEGCRSCASSCWLESNLVFNLNPRSIANWLRHLLLRKSRNPA